MKNDLKDMNLDFLFKAAGKADFYNLQKEYGFETRVLSRVKELRSAGTAFLSLSWKLIPLFLTIVMCLILLTTAFEKTQIADVRAAAGFSGERSALVASLLGD